MWVALTGRNRYSGTSRYPYPEADAYLPCPWSHYGSTGSIPCLNYNNNVLPSYEVMSKYSHDNKPSSLATSSQPYNAGIRSSDFGTSYINFRATSSGPVDPHIPIRNQEIPEYTSDLSGTGGRGDYSAYESHIGGVYGYEEKGLALSPSEVDQGYSSLSRSHKDDKLSSYHDYMKEPYSQDQQQLDHGFRSRPRQGVGREEGFHLMKASYRGQRGYHDDEEDTTTSPLSSLGSRDSDRESLAELKRRYGGVKMEEEEGQRSQGQRGRAATVQTEEPHPKSANLRRYHSDKTPEKKTFNQQEAAEEDAMPTWRKRRLEREQRRKEFLSMSETKAQEREKLKATELADSEDSEAGQEAMRQRFRDRVKERQQKLQEERESLLRERQLEREREQKSDRTVQGGDDGGDMGTLGAREGESITDKTRHLTAEDMKTILLKRDSPLLRSRYAEAKRKKDQEKDLSRDELPVEKPEDKQPEPKSRSSALSRSRPLSTGDGEHYRKKVQEAHHGEPKVSAKTSDSKDSVTSPKQSPNVAPTSTPSQMQRQPKHTEHRKGVKTVEKSSQPPPKISQTLSQKVEEETTPSSAAGGQPSAHVLKTEEQEMGKAQRGKMKSKYLEAVGEDDPSSAAILSRMGVSYGRPHEKQATQSKETSVKVESQNKQDERSKKVMQSKPSSEKQSGTVNKALVKPETTSHSQMMATRGGQLGSVEDSQQQQSVPRSQDNSRRSSVESMNSDHSSSSSQRLGRSQVAKRYSDALETGDNQEQFKGFKLFDIKNAQKKQEGVIEKKDSQESKVRRVQSAKVNKQEKLIREEVKEAVENIPVIRRSQSTKSKSQAASNTDQDGESSVQYTKPGQRSVASDFLENTDLRNLEASHIKSGTLAARFAESLSAISAEKAEEEHQKKKQLEEYFKDAPQPSGKRTLKAYSGSKTSGLPTQHSLEEKPQEEPVQKPKEKIPKAAQRKKAYVKAKTTDVSSLISAVKDTKENETEKGEMAPANVSQEEKPTEQSRLERINSYKEERRKQLAVLAATFSGEDQGSDKEKLDILPSLFHVASQSESTKGITRSSSLREDSPAKTSSPGISARSQSFREGKGQGQGQGRQHSPSPEKVVSTDSLPVSDKFSKFREQFGTVKDPIIMKTFSTQKPSSKTDIQKESKKDSTKITKTKSTTEVTKEEGIEKGGDKPQQRKRRQLPTPPATDAVGQSPVVQSHVAVEPQTRDVDSKKLDVTKYSQRAEESTQTQQVVVQNQKPEFKTKEEVSTGVAKQPEQNKTSQKRPTSLEMSTKKDKKGGTEQSKSENKEASSSNTNVQKQKSKVSPASALATAAVSASDAAPKMAVFVASKQVPTKSEPQKKETKTRPINRQRQSPAKESTVKEPSPVPITPVVAKVFQPQQKATFTKIEPKIQTQEESPVIERPPSLLKESGKMFYQQLQDGQQVIQSQSVVKPLESSSVGVIQTSVQSQIHEPPVLSKPLSQNINVEESPIVSRSVCSDMAPVVHDNKQGPVTNVPGQQIEHGPLSPTPVSTIQISVSQPSTQKPMSRLAQKVEMNKLARAEATLRAAIQDTPPCEEVEKEVPERKVLISARDVVRPEKEARMIMAPTGHMTAFPSAQKIAVQQRVEPSQLPCEEVQDISTETNKTSQRVLISSQHSDGKTRAAYAKAVVSEPEAVSVISEPVVPPGGKGVLRQHSADRLKPTLDDRTKEASPALSSGSESSSKRLSGDFSSIRVSGEFDMAHIIEKLSSRPEEPPKASQTQGSLIPETVPSVSETRAKVADLLQPLDKRREKASSEERYSDDGLKQKLDLIRRQKYAARKSEFLSAAGFDKSKSTSDSDEQPNIPKELSPLIQEQMAKIQEQIPHLHKPKHQDSQSEEQVDEFSAHAPTIIHRKTSDPTRVKEQQHVLYAAQNFPPPQQKSELVSQPPERYLQPVRSKSLRADTRRKSAEVARILNKSPETNLDDLLLENMDYLSDHDLVQKAAEKAGKKPSEKGKTKRSLRKKMMRRSHSDSSGMTEIALSKRAAVEEMQMSGRMFVATTSRGDYSTTLEADRAAVDSSLDSSSDAQTTQRFVHSQTKHYGARGVLETEDSVKGLDSFVHSHSAKGGNLVPEVLSQDSESSSSLSGRGSERRRRIDKSSVRKSSLNMGSVDEDGERNQGRQIQSESHTSSQPESTSDLLTLHGTSSHSANSKNHAQDKNTNSVLDKILPSKFPIPASRVSSAISKFSSEESEKSQGEGCRRKPDDGTLKKITRRNDFSSLLQKFSASDPSGSETDQPSPRPRLSLRRQEACALSSSSDSDTRRTPERTQSLRLGKSPTPERELVSPVQRAGSFKSAFMKRRYSPEPTNRVPLSDSNPPSQEQSVTASKSGSLMVSPTSEDSTVHHDDLSNSVTSAQQQEPPSRSQPYKREVTETNQMSKDSKTHGGSYHCSTSDKPTPELSAVLNKRQDIVREQQERGVEAERARIADKTVEKESVSHFAAENDEVLIDTEVASMLNARRKETDAHLAHEQKLETPQTKVQPEVKGHQPDVVSSVTQSKSQIPTDRPDVISHQVSSKRVPESKGTNQSSTEKKFTMSDLDASLAVLEKAAKGMDEANTDECFDSSLSSVHLNSREEMKEFLGHFQPEKPVDVSAPRERTSSSSSQSDNPVAKVKAKIARRHSSSSKSQEKLRKSPSPEPTTRPAPQTVLSPLKDRLASPVGKSGSSVKRTQSLNTAERPRGILKRTPSLKHSGVIVDSELASILEQRRKQEGNDSEEEEVKTFDPKKDIEETLKREKLHHQQSVSSEGPKEEGEEEKEEDNNGVSSLSMSERIYHMQAKLEEITSSPVTPKNKSGTGTPGSLRRSELSLFSQSSFDSVPSSLCGEQLFEKLSNLTTHGPSISERKQQFQQGKKEGWRRRTAPVTTEEIHEADNLESVRKLRAEVARKTSKNVFEQINAQQIKYHGRKTEYPHSYAISLRKSQKRRRNRCNSVPTTSAELGAIPEGQIAIAMAALRAKNVGHKDSKADSGILSGSDSETNLDADGLRRLSMDFDVSEDDPARMSVSAKASLFAKQIQEKEKSKADRPKNSASGAKRYIDRKKRERSRTQPVTEDEVKTAAEFADAEEQEGEGTQSQQEVDNLGDAQPSKKPPPAVTSKPERSSSMDEEGDEQGEKDELSRTASKKKCMTKRLRRRRRSLADKVKLFSNLKKEEEKKKPSAPVVRRKNRKLTSRFNTQPITYEEVEKAAEYRISPLAMSMVKPPDPEILAGLPLSAQRDIMAKHAEASLSQPSSRASSRPGSMMDLSGSVSEQGRSKPGSTADLNSDLKSSDGHKGILKYDHPTHDADIKSILKADGEKSDHLEPKGILKGEVTKKKDSEPKGILKQGESESEHSDTDHRSILKHSDDSAHGVVSPVASDTDTKSILKHQESEERLLKTAEQKAAIRKDLALCLGKRPTEPRGILKRETSYETPSNEPEKTSLKKPHQPAGLMSELKGILKRDSLDEPSESEDGDLSEHKDEAEKVKATDGAEEVKAVDESYAQEEVQGQDESADSEEPSTPRRRRERYLTQPAEISSPNKSPEIPRRIRYTGRNKTQPITPEEKREAESNDVTANSSIKDRLSALQKSGEEGWRKRVSKNLDLDSRRSPSPSAEDVTVRLREKRAVSPALPRPSSIADRLSQLDTAQVGWKGRVGDKDVKKFTIAHKMGGQVEESPLVSKLKRRQRRTGSESESGSELSSPSTPSKEWTKIPIPTELVTDTEAAKPKPAEALVDDEEEDKGPVKVAVPTQDISSLESFFTSRTMEEITSEKFDVDITTFDEIFIEANDILETRKKIKPKRRHNTKGRNPLRTINVEVKAEYEEVKVGYADQELRRVKTAQIAKDAGFAQEALAGLASKENFAKVALRKTGDQTNVGTSRLEPYKDLMLIHIKGRRKIQTRLVEPSAKSVNSGDCYVLVTPDKVISWIGEYSNVIEKAKAADVATVIFQKKDLGCKSATGVGTVEEARQHLGTGKHFWAALGGKKQVSPAGPAEEDELYENHVVETNMVYRLEDGTLKPFTEYWGNTPKYEMLKKDAVLVFDFGSELYLWQGKSVKPEHRKTGLKLARQLYEKGYNYEQCDINPLCPLNCEGEGSLPMSAPSRPEWALFGKVNQNMETVLFREKFSDWPDTSRLIKVKSQTDLTQKTDAVEMKPYDAKLMIPVDTSPVTLVLEGSHVGRGNTWSEDMQGFIKEQEIHTLATTVWHVLEYDHYKVPEQSYGQFHEGDTYVVRWQYMITSKGMKDIKGTASTKKSLVGRERCAYFFWQGKASTVNEKGASALMTVELDEERGPQVRVDEGKELPCFLNLFDLMIIHIGKREEESTNTQGPWRCYCVRNDYENESCLLEIAAGAQCLRSRSSFIFLNVITGLVYIWHGAKSPEHIRKMAANSVEKLKVKCPLEVGLEEAAKITSIEMEEGKERADFWRLLEAEPNDRSLYHSLLKDPLSYDYTLRLFHMTSVSGAMEVHEILNPSRTPDLVTSFPVLQSDLYKASQPALFLVDNQHVVYLWHGWWPEGDQEVENVTTGSALSRFNTDRKCAIETTLQYCTEKNSDNPPEAIAVYAGLEPLEFINLFPFWEVHTPAKDSNLKEGKRDRDSTPVRELRDKVNQAHYSFDELQERPLPEGVDPLKLESYLTDREFQEILEMTKEEFYALPQWRQHNLKQQVDLY